jgi:hypothetical protein
MRILVLFIAVILTLCACSKDSKKFPYPELEPDFGTFLDGARAYANKHGKGQAAYKNATLPYAPLDMSEGGKLNGQKLKDLRALAFGSLAHMFAADFNLRIDEVFCSPECWQSRVTRMRGSVKEILEIRNRFIKLNNVEVISHWNSNNQFRVNNWIYTEANGLSDADVLHAKPSTDFGLVSSGVWEDPSAADQKVANELKISGKPIVERLRKLNLVAIARDDDASTLIIADGFAGNAWGLRILPGQGANSDAKPAEGDWVKIQNGVWFFRKGGLPRPAGS